jgi:hypothetical protein
MLKYIEPHFYEVMSVFTLGYNSENWIIYRYAKTNDESAEMKFQRLVAGLTVLEYKSQLNARDINDEMKNKR